MIRKQSCMNMKAQQLRTMVLDVMRRAGAGHVATSLSCADIITALYYGGVLRFDPKNPQKPDRDRFLMSKGHASTILYCALADLGFFPVDDLWRTGHEDGAMGVHLQPDIPGVEATSGSLGNGLGLACGIALAGLRNDMAYMTYVLLGDGELNEGSIWEGLLFAAHHKLNNLVLIIDRNRMCCAGYTENILQLAPLDKKFESFGVVIRTVDGHDCEALADELRRLRARPFPGPVCVIAETVKGKGLPSVENTPMCHHYSPKGEELEKAFAELRGE